MKKPLTDEDLHDRASIDGRVSFAMIAFVVGAGLVALLDRVGVPEKIVGLLGPVLAMAGLSLIGLLLHAVRVSRFYAAGRAVPPPYAGLATTALLTAMVLPFVPPNFGAFPLLSVWIGFAAGLVITAFLSGPLLRKTGAFSLPDLISSRFPHAGVRLGVIVVVAAVALLIAAAGLDGAIRTLSLSLGIEKRYAALIAAVVLMCIVIPGGMSGVVWTAMGAAGVFFAALCLPLAAIMFSGNSLPLPVIGDTENFYKAVEMIAAWHGASDWDGNSLAIIGAVAIGVACLAPLLSPAATTADTHDARRAGLSAITWSIVTIAVILVTVAAAALILADFLIGFRPDRMPQFAYAAGDKGFLNICGAAFATAEQALAACSAKTGSTRLVLRSQDLSPQGLWLLMGLPGFRGYGVAFSALVGTAVISVSLAFAAAGFQAFGTAIGHDGLYRAHNTSALTSRRLAMTRIVMVIAILGVSALLGRTEIDARQAIGLAILFSTAAIAPLLALSMWPRAAGIDAAVALLVGLGMAGTIIALRGVVPDIETLCFAALVAAVAGLAAGIAVSFFHSGGLATEGSTFVHGLLHGKADLLNRDKGA